MAYSNLIGQKKVAVVKKVAVPNGTGLCFPRGGVGLLPMKQLLDFFFGKSFTKEGDAC